MFSEGYFSAYFRVGQKLARTSSGLHTTEEHEDFHFRWHVLYYDSVDRYTEMYSRRCYPCRGALLKATLFLSAQRSTESEKRAARHANTDCNDYYPANYTGRKPKCIERDARLVDVSRKEAVELGRLNDLTNYTCQ